MTGASARQWQARPPPRTVTDPPEHAAVKWSHRRTQPWRSDGCSG